MLSLLLLYAIFSGLSSLFLLGNCEEAILILAKNSINYGLTFFAKCGILNFEGIPETVGGRFRLPEGSE